MNLSGEDEADRPPRSGTRSPAAPVVLRGVGGVAGICSLAVADHVTLPPVPAARS